MRPATRVAWFLISGAASAILVAGAAALRDRVPLNTPQAAIWPPPDIEKYGGAVASSTLHSAAYLVIVGRPGVLTWRLDDTVGTLPAPGWLRRYASRIPARIPPGSPQVVQLDAVGWPLPYLLSARRDPIIIVGRRPTGSIFMLEAGFRDSTKVSFVASTGALRASARDFWDGELAIDWPGLLWAVTVYGTAGVLLVESPSRLRRAYRRSRGLCCWCSYPVGDASICSECGVRTGRSGGHRTA
jgi:hypothetical protein